MVAAAPRTWNATVSVCWLPVVVAALVAGRLAWSVVLTHLRPPLEPTGTHDYVTEIHHHAEAFMRTLAERLGKTAVFVTHDLVEATRVDDVEKNRLCIPTRTLNQPSDWIRAYRGMVRIDEISERVR